MNFQCCAKMQARYLLPWHFFWQNYSFSAVMYISVRVLLRCKLLNYSVEGLQTRLVKWLPINKTLQNQISPDILSRSCHTARVQVWISVAFASPQSRTRKNKTKQKKNSGEKDNCKYWQSHLTNKCHCQRTQTGNPRGWRPRLPTPALSTFFFPPKPPARPAPKLTNQRSFHSSAVAATFPRVGHETLMAADTGNTSSFLYAAAVKWFNDENVQVALVISEA